MSKVWALCRSMFEQEEGGNKTQPEVVASAKDQVDEFARKFEQSELLLVS
jgi:hypothetical protein